MPVGEEEEEDQEEDPEEEEDIVLALAEALPVVATAAPAEVQAAALEVPAPMEAPALEAPAVEVVAPPYLLTQAPAFLEVGEELQVLQTPEPIQVQTTTATVPATADTDPVLTSQERATAMHRKDTEPDGELTSRRLEEILTPRKLSGLA